MEIFYNKCFRNWRYVTISGFNPKSKVIVETREGCGVFATQDCGDVYVMTIYGAIVLQCRMAVMFTSLLNERYELETVVAGNHLQTCNVWSCKCTLLSVTQQLLVM